MATMKRRVIYLSDDDWASATRLATEYDTSISSVIRLLVSARIAGAEFNASLDKFQAMMTMPAQEAAKVAEDIRSFNSRPFRPVPKRSAK